jgi:DNA-binding beta-propeller fold protein YncE
MRRVVGLALVGVLSFTLVGTPTSRAATVSSAWPVGAAPLGLAFDGSSGKVYVTNSETTMRDGTGRISVVDPATGSIGSLLTSLTASVVIADTSARRLYSSNAAPDGSSASVDVFDLNNGATVASLPGVGGLGLALDAAAHRLFAGGHELNIIDTTTNTHVGTPLAAPAGGGWFGVAVDPGLKRLYLADGSESAPMLFVYDYDSQDVLTPAKPPTVALGNAVRSGLVVDAARHLVFAVGSDITGGSASAFYVIDADTLQVVHTTALSGFPMGIALDTNRIFISLKRSETAGRVYVLDGATFEVTDTIPLDTFAPGLPLLHTDGRLYVGDYNKGGGTNSSLVALDPNNHAPVFQSFALSPSSPTTSDTLQVDATATDPDLRGMGVPDPTTLSYEWFRDSALIDGATGTTLDLNTLGNGGSGYAISVRVTASDGRLSSTATSSVDVVNTAHTPSVTVSISNSSPKKNDTLVATAVGTDEDGDALTYTYTWHVNGVLKKTTTTDAATDSFDLKVKGNGDKGDVVMLTVTASDSTLTSPAATLSATLR